MKTMYMAFVRSILEYGNVLYMGAAQTHLDKLDAVQSAAEKFGRFKADSLQSRREAAAIDLALKLLDQDCRPGLNQFAPALISGLSVNHDHSTQTQDRMDGIQLQPCVLSKYPLDIFRRSFLGSIHTIWAKLPQDLLRKGKQSKWIYISKKCKKFLKEQ